MTGIIIYIDKEGNKKVFGVQGMADACKNNLFIIVCCSIWFDWVERGIRSAI